MGHMADTANAVWRFYRDGFRSMTWGRTLWLIIIVKLTVLFGVLRWCFFQPHMAGMSADEKQDYVSAELMHRRAVTAPINVWK